MKHNDEIKRLFKLYLEGRTNSRQEEVLFRYLKSRNGADKEFLDQMENVWINEPSTRDDSNETNEGIEQLWSEIGTRKQRKINRHQVLKYAASLVLICSATLAWFNYQQQPQKAKPIAFLSKVTAPGEKVKMILPDSSVVYLGSRSKLTWPERFIKGQHRDVNLEGEAFFEVKHDKASPFIIHAGNMQTRVLGTSFNIYAYPEDKLFTVAVRTGKVAVSENGSSGLRNLSLLTPGMKLVFQKASGAYMINNNERVADVNSWTMNRFVFHDESLENMLIRLERYYRVHFDIQNLEIANCRFNATFTNKNIIDVMKQLKVMSGGHIKYKMNDDKTTIALWGKACQ